jgi:hypothetical protein
VAAVDDVLEVGADRQRRDGKPADADLPSSGKATFLRHKQVERRHLVRQQHGEGARPHERRRRFVSTDALTTTTLIAAHASGLVVVCHLRGLHSQRDGFAAVPLAEGLLIWWLHLLQRAEDEAVLPRGEEETVQHGEQQKARTDGGSAIKVSQLNNADRLFGFSH